MDKNGRGGGGQRDGGLCEGECEIVDAEIVVTVGADGVWVRGLAQMRMGERGCTMSVGRPEGPWYVVAS